MSRYCIDSHLADELRTAAADSNHITGQTHNFYRYPARFSPTFAAAAIRCFSRPGELVLDPYMGGGTVVIESLVAGRRVVGNDLNSLAVFVAAAKTTPLIRGEIHTIREWINRSSRILSYRGVLRENRVLSQEKMKNLGLVRARFIKKVIAIALADIESLPTPNAQRFARCMLLRTAQWALDGRRTHTRLAEFRERLITTGHEMLAALAAFESVIRPRFPSIGEARFLAQGDATRIRQLRLFARRKEKAALIVTSPPYPGVHVLYHRWQVDGRKETSAPYWIINGKDGQSASYYTFGDRRQSSSDDYFQHSLRTLKSIKSVLRRGGFMVQLVAFADPVVQLPRYLANMAAAGFEEILVPVGENFSADGRIWRAVPNRKWHAARKGITHSSCEVVLIHRAQ
jgi:DNA modification methylase